MSFRLQSLSLALAATVVVLFAGADDQATSPKKQTPPEAIRKGVAYLVQVQGKDGGWGKHETMSQIVPAITALGLIALEANAEHVAPAERDQVKKASDKARELIDKAEITTGPVKYYQMQPRNWDNSVRLYWYLHIPRERRTKEEQAKIQTLVDALESSQEKEGGWTYLANWAVGMEKSTTFLSSWVLMALLEARHQGAKVADGTIDKGAAFLKKLRNANGTYKYYFRPNATVSESPIGSSARNVGSELALYMAGHSDQEKLQWAVANFFQQRNELDKSRTGKKPKGVGTSHWGTDNIAPYFFFYSHYCTLQAFKHIDKDARMVVNKDKPEMKQTAAECTAALRDILVEIQRPDGSWGTASEKDGNYNTALALLGLSDHRLVTCPPQKPAGKK